LPAGPSVWGEVLDAPVPTARPRGARSSLASERQDAVWPSALLALAVPSVRLRSGEAVARPPAPPRHVAMPVPGIGSATPPMPSVPFVK
jgi:hypothetical protein